MEKIKSHEAIITKLGSGLIAAWPLREPVIEVIKVAGFVSFGDDPSYRA